MCLVSSIFILMFSFTFLFSVKCHFLSVLVVLEGFNVALFLIGSFFLGEAYNSFGVYFLIFFLVFGVVEIVIGFSLLVSGSRTVSRVGVKSYSFMGVLNLSLFSTVDCYSMGSFSYLGLE